MRSALVWFAIGFLMLLLGGCFTFAVPGWIRDGASDVKKLEPLSATILADSATGREVLIEATVSPRNPTVYRDLVAYVREEQVRDSDGERSWRVSGSETPDLLLEMPDGRVTLQEGYSVGSFSTVHREGETRYTGVQANDAVLVVGELVPSSELPTIDARLFVEGTKASYLDTQETGAQIFFYVGIGIIVIAVILEGIGVVVLLFKA